MASLPWVIGLMSGTSLDGVDAALLKTDGSRVGEQGLALTLEYDDAFRAKMRDATYSHEASDALVRELTDWHVRAVKELLARAKLAPKDVLLIGFHGQTIGHNPAQGWTKQIGDGAQLARETSIDVICDFRSADVAAGGQGAPMVPLYHAAIAEAKGLELPTVFLNIGGIANVTWVGTHNALKEGVTRADILALDVGAGNVLLNEWMLKHTGQAMDLHGETAAKGTVNEAVLTKLLAHPFFSLPAPKSLDRNDFNLDALEELSVADGAATLTTFTAAGIAKAAEHFPAPAKNWYICGGGVNNPTLMHEIKHALSGAQVQSISEIGFSADALEAQAFAFLAARSKCKLPLSLPSTTSADHAVLGGVFCPSACDDDS